MECFRKRGTPTIVLLEYLLLLCVNLELSLHLPNKTFTKKRQVLPSKNLWACGSNNTGVWHLTTCGLVVS